jgi:hypothetical protein
MNERKPLMTDMVSIKKTSQPAKKDVFVRESEMGDDDLFIQPQLVVHNNYSNENEDVKKKPINFLGVIIFFCVIMLILGIGGLFSSARIEITPIQKTGVVDITTIARNSQGKELLSFATATKVITETKIIPALGKTEKSSFAKGKIRFYNTKNIPIKITTGSVVVTADGVRYKTDTTVTVPKNQLTKQGQVNHGRKNSGLSEEMLIAMGLADNNEPEPGQIGFAPKGAIGELGGGFKMDDFKELPTLGQ